jgi:hypothetical protein
LFANGKGLLVGCDGITTTAHRLRSGLVVVSTLNVSLALPSQDRNKKPQGALFLVVDALEGPRHVDDGDDDDDDDNATSTGASEQDHSCESLSSNSAALAANKSQSVKVVWGSDASFHHRFWPAVHAGNPFHLLDDLIMSQHSLCFCFCPQMQPA